jgi:molybdopterin-guanine dinucleotide biosynthesis protein
MNRLLLIGIGASHSGSGKTTLAAKILQNVALCPSPCARRLCLKWGAIKYTRTVSPPELISDRTILMEEGKDTCKMLTAGAADVVWVRSGMSGLMDALSEAVTRLSHLDVLIVEGNSAIEFLNPDIVLFIFGKGREYWKPGIEKLAARADIIFADDDVQLPADVQPRHRFPRELSENGSKGFITALTRMVYERRAETRDAETGC